MCAPAFAHRERRSASGGGASGRLTGPASGSGCRCCAPVTAPILRVEGILDLAGAARPVAVHGVQHRVHPSMHRAAWFEGRRSSRLVLIVDGSEEARIRTSFAVLAGLR
ncbi:CobW C-terminal domain-containing protein [Methylorubrum populi]|uniref:GTP-binding protein n=1 Tax=Methylorubrum populi TaxID=223967 RepID=UPI00015D34F6|nr:MAG: hypothetical protein DI590_23000 [Methylorubrum populi]